VRTHGATKATKRRSSGQGRAAIRVVIADAHPVVREGLRRLLQAEEGFTVIGQAENGSQALDLVKSEHPDILMLDNGMPGLSAVQVLRELSNLDTPCRVILLNAALDRTEILEVLRLGVKGVMAKNTTVALVIKSIRTVMAGQYWIGRESVSDLIGCLIPRRPGDPALPFAGKADLTSRELQIVTAVGNGYSNKEIASRLSLSEHTVKHHLSSIFDKLGMTNRLEVALFAIKHQLVDEDETFK
jgi:two-component system, NarL family, nitrate/nitrite response regulator NarL